MRELKKMAEATSARIHKLEEELQRERADITYMRIMWWQRYNDAILHQRETETGQMLSYLYSQLQNADTDVERADNLIDFAKQSLDEFVACFDDVIV